jgi:predicted PurR-regulated permease PerM
MKAFFARLVQLLTSPFRWAYERERKKTYDTLDRISLIVALIAGAVGCALGLMIAVLQIPQPWLR